MALRTRWYHWLVRRFTYQRRLMRDLGAARLPAADGHGELTSTDLSQNSN